jgi:hypothetical protein
MRRINSNVLIKRMPDTPSPPPNAQKKKQKCDYCRKEGHTIEGCYHKKNKERKQSKEHHIVCIGIDGNNDFPLRKEMTLLHRAEKDKYDTFLCEQYNMTRDTFIFDSGAPSHMHFSKDCMVSLKPLTISIKVGNTEDIYSEVIGTFKGPCDTERWFNIPYNHLQCTTICTRSVCKPVLYDMCSLY